MIGTSGLPYYNTEVLYAYRMYLVLDHWIHYTLQMVWWIPYQVPMYWLAVREYQDAWLGTPGGLLRIPIVWMVHAIHEIQYTY